MSHRCLSIGFLGGFRLQWEDNPCQIQAASDASLRLRTLLAYLLLHPGTAQHREHLAFLFWPDTNEAQALSNLRNLLYKLRRLLPTSEQFLLIEGRTVQWRSDSSYCFDVAEFEKAVAGAKTLTNLEQAVDCYHGDFLPGCYDDWVLAERERLRQLMLSTLERLIEQLEANREYRRAIRQGHRLLQLEPFNEASYRKMLSLYVADHDRAGALQLYARCVAMLKDEFGATPSPETEEIYERLQHPNPSLPVNVGVSAYQPSLVGRAKEWQQLLDSWHRASSGRSHCLLITGEAGMGKTRLATELQSWVAGLGYVTAMAHCYAAEGVLAYAPIVEWLRLPPLYHRLNTIEDIWFSEVARLLPELLPARPHLTPPGPLSTGWQRQRFFEALARTFFHLATPLLLVLDDIQWADRDTLEWLHFLLRLERSPREAIGNSTAAAGRVLLIGTMRSEAVDEHHPLHELQAALYHEDAFVEIPLVGLTGEETTALAECLMKQPLAAQQSAHIFQETEGNPLFIVEMMRSALESGAIAKWNDHQSDSDSRHQSTVASFAQTPLPPKVYGLIQARLTELSMPARELATIAATIGRAFPYVVLAKAIPQSEELLAQSLDELCRRQIIRERDGDYYDFTHDKLREVTYNSQSAVRRRLAHKAIAQALESIVQEGSFINGLHNGVSGQIANHYALAGIPEKAVHFYQQAAAAAHRLSAYQDAVHSYHCALSLLHSATADEIAVAMELHEQLADILCILSQYADARAHFTQALSHVDVKTLLVSARLNRKIGNTWREEYQYEQAMQFYRVAVDTLLHRPIALHDTDPEQISVSLSNERLAQAPYSVTWWEEWIQVQLEIDLVHYWLAETEASLHLQLELEPIIEVHGTIGQRATFCQRRTQLELRRHRSIASTEAVDYAQRSLMIYQQSAMKDNLPAAHFMLGFTLLWHNDLARAAAELQEALYLANQNGDRSLQARALTYLTIIARQRGQVEETRQFAAQALAVANDIHMPEYMALARANQAWLAWCSHESHALQEHGYAARELWHQLPVTHASAPFQWTALWPLLADAVEGEELATAVGYGRALLDPHQQQLPDRLVTALSAAIAAWDQGDECNVVHALHVAITSAHELHYL